MAKNNRGNLIEILINAEATDYTLAELKKMSNSQVEEEFEDLGDEYNIPKNNYKNITQEDFERKQNEEGADLFPNGKDDGHEEMFI